MLVCAYVRRHVHSRRLQQADRTVRQGFRRHDRPGQGRKKEGTLNVIALPPTWADYGKILSAFHRKYDIKIDSYNPDGNSQQEVDAVKAHAGTHAAGRRRPGAGHHGRQLSLCTPYKVAEWNQIPKGLKAKNAVWYDDYTGYESIGYPPTS